MKFNSSHGINISNGEELAIYPSPAAYGGDVQIVRQGNSKRVTLLHGKTSYSYANAVYGQKI